MDQPADFTLFLGRFHPIILHLPIGFLVIAFLLETLSRFREKYKSLQSAVGIVLLAGAASAIVAAFLGFLLSKGGGYNEDLLQLHQWLGIGAAVVACVAYVLKIQKDKAFSPGLDKAYFSIFSIAMVILMLAGHYGGSLTHGSDYLTQYMPNGMRAVAGLPPKEKPMEVYSGDINQAVVYADLVQPILESRCTSCHNSSKKKGDLAMKTIEQLLKGGESGPALVAGNAVESEIIKRIHLPEEDDDHMPPDGKKQLTDDQVVLLGWWIDQGATADKTVANLERTEEIDQVLTNLYGETSKDQHLYAEEIEPANEGDIQKLQETGAQVMQLAQDNNWLQIKAGNMDESQTNDLLAGLNKVANQVTWLDLGNSSANDQVLEGIASLNNLTRLHLENTKITDVGLQSLKDMEFLEYLNLYGTEVTDEGLSHLKPLKNLKKLYLWQTDVTQDGIASLQTTLPDLKIDTGISDSTIQAFKKKE